MISLNIEKTLGFISKENVFAYEAQVKAAQEALENGTGKGNDFLGWLHLPSSITKEHLADLKATAQVLRENCEAVVVAGIGGSYLGARAVIEALSNSFAWLQDKKSGPVILYAGHNIGEDYLYELTEYLKDKKFGVINISKSGTTTETALAFRLLKKQCEDQRGKEMAKKVIVAVTDAKKGAARVTADNEGYKSFIIPDNVGGRFSVLTPVGLLPIAVAGFDIEKLVAGAAAMEKACGKDVPFAENPAAIYAATRNELYKNGKKIEILVNFNPKLHYVSEWWKQLYGESEGKENKGIFPASVDFSTDLHSMGQWIQEGERTIYETVISVEKTQYSLQVPSDEANLDGLNFLAGKHVDEVNKIGFDGIQNAVHAEKRLGGDGGKRLALFHDMQVIIARQLKDLHDGIEHFPVLAGQADDAFDLLAGLQRLDKRRHFDGLRPCAEDGHDFQLIHAVPPVFLPARPPTDRSSRRSA